MSGRTKQQSPICLQVRESAKALVTRGDDVLIVKERHADGSTFWTLPGGGVEPTETRPAALRRELHEELRCRGTVAQNIARYWYAHTGGSNTVSVWFVYDCALLSPLSPNLKEGILAKRWASPDELPPNTLPQVRYLTESYVSDELNSYGDHLGLRETQSV